MVLNKKTFITFITFIITIFIASTEKCDAWEHETCNMIKTKLGVIRVIQGTAGLPADTITFNGKRVFEGQMGYAFLYKSFQTSNYIAVLFGENPGGSGTPVDTLYFLLLRQGSKPSIVTNEDFYSADGIMNIKQKNNDVVFDLGFEEKKRKTAILTSGNVLVQYATVGAIPMKLESCQLLYENSMSECMERKKRNNDCGQAYDGDCHATMTGITVLSSHPGFVSSALSEICTTVCKTGKAITFEQFKKKVCSIK